MIRPARYQDAPEIEQLIRNQHTRSKYAGRVAIVDKALAQVVLGAIMGMNQSGPHATHCAVSVEGGKVRGFIAGSLARIYNIGDKLGASDQFLVNEGRTGASLQLIDSYIAWASANPKVVEIGLSWTDALPGADRAALLYQRKGFSLVGEQFVLRLDQDAQRIAA